MLTLIKAYGIISEYQVTDEKSKYKKWISKNKTSKKKQQLLVYYFALFYSKKLTKINNKKF